MRLKGAKKLSFNIRKQMKGMSQRELSIRIGVTAACVSNWMNCKTTPGLTALGHLARALGCNVADLLQGITTEELL